MPTHAPLFPYTTLFRSFQPKGHIEVKPLGDFASARLVASSQDLLVSKTGKVPVALEGGDFEFVTKVEIEKVNDKFATPSDRKSTRLNSSHRCISYAVFC